MRCITVDAIYTACEVPATVHSLRGTLLSITANDYLSCAQTFKLGQSSHSL